MPFELKIALNDAGQLAITGPIENEMICYYLLEKGRQVVAEHHATKAARLVQPATALPFAISKGGNGHV
jgi:hypothetical protein